MTRTWKVALAVVLSFGVVHGIAACSSSPAEFLGMMEDMHPGFTAGLLGGGL